MSQNDESLAMRSTVPATREHVLSQDVIGMRSLVGEALRRGHGYASQIVPLLGERIVRNGWTVKLSDLDAAAGVAEEYLLLMLEDAAAWMPTYCAEDSASRSCIKGTIREAIQTGAEQYQHTIRDSAVPAGDILNGSVAPPLDPRWLQSESDRLLHSLLATLTAQGVPVPGATNLLAEMDAKSGEATAVFVSSSGADREARTDWIPDPDGLPYQWAVRQRGTAYYIARRTRGRRTWHHAVAVSEGESSVIARLMSAILRAPQLYS